jgi:AcrR family transcriptional regulator
MTDPGAQDGRRGRTEAGRRKVGEVLFDLVAEHGRLPSVEEVAHRAGVSRRSVYRYFDGVSALEVETAQVMRERLTREVPLPTPNGQVAQRVRALLEHRATLYERVAPVRRYLDQTAPGSKSVARFLEQARSMLRVNLVALFPALARRGGARLAALELSTSWEAWNTLRVAQNLTVAEAKQAMAVMVNLLVR